MKINDKKLEYAEKLEEQQSLGKKLNRKQRRFLKSVSHKIATEEL